MKQEWKRTARSAAYDYPELYARIRELRRARITAPLENNPGGSSESRKTEEVALRELPPGDMLRLEAVEHGLRLCAMYGNAEKRRRLVTLVYFRRSHTVCGAGMKLGISQNTAERWNRDFLTAVYGYLIAEKNKTPTF